MSPRRDHIRLKTKLCSALCQLVRFDEAIGEYVKIIPYELSKRLTEDEILSRFDFHHFPIPKAHGGPDAHWNLQPEEKDVHKEITAKIDVPRIAKGKRVAAAAASHAARMASKVGDHKRATAILAAAHRQPRAKRKIPVPANPWPAKGTRPFAQRQRSAR